VGSYLEVSMPTFIEHESGGVIGISACCDALARIVDFPAVLSAIELIKGED
jgi:hypothetical protein